MTKPGEVLFNLVALLNLAALFFWGLFLVQGPEMLVDWRFLVTFTGPVAFWTAVITILVRLIRSGYRPRLLTISSSLSNGRLRSTTSLAKRESRYPLADQQRPS